LGAKNNPMFSILATSSIAFTVIILALVLLLLLAQKKLVQSGPVKITINGERVLTVSAGSSLLSTLGNEKIFLPSACGGGGTCAMCKCVVESGGGDVLPTEVGHLTRKEQKDKVRLGCQVKVKQDLNLMKFSASRSGSVRLFPTTTSPLS
jgi:Na+-transporting NADH:ubiquinone oxidoreductase subunit F